jgi:hypothetical protein
MMDKKIVSKLILVVIAISIFIGSIIYIFFKVDKNVIQRLDYVSYLTAARLIKSNYSTELYDVDRQLQVQAKILGKNPETMGSILLYLYLPFSALIFYPLTLISLISGYRLILLVNLVLLAAVGFIFKMTFVKGNTGHLKYILLPFLFLPSLMVVYTGQLSALLLLVYVSIYTTLIKKKYLSAGLISGLLLIKPQHFLIVPFIFLIVKGKKEYYIGAVISMCILMIISWKITGINALVHYPSFLINTNNYEFNVDFNDLYTIFPILEKLTRLLNIDKAIAFLINSILYFATLALFKAKFVNKKDIKKYFIIAILLSLTFMVRVYIQDLILLLIPIYYFLSKKTVLNQRKLLVIFFFLPWLGMIGTSYLGGIIILLVAFYLMDVKAFQILSSFARIFIK